MFTSSGIIVYLAEKQYCWLSCTYSIHTVSYVFKVFRNQVLDALNSYLQGLVHVARKMPKNAHAHFILGLMCQRLGQPQKVGFGACSLFLFYINMHAKNLDQVKILYIRRFWHMRRQQRSCSALRQRSIGQIFFHWFKFTMHRCSNPDN